MAAQSERLFNSEFDQNIPSVVEAGEPAFPPVAERIVLRLEDLVQDQNGEVVLFNDSHVPQLAVETSSRLVDKGLASSHVTAAGEDVDGFSFMKFESGVTIYYQHGVEVMVVEG